MVTVYASHCLRKKGDISLVAKIALVPDTVDMPRTARAAVGGYSYHVLNRGNASAAIFHDADDYFAFAALLRQACARRPMLVLGEWKDCPECCC